MKHIVFYMQIFHSIMVSFITKILPPNHNVWGRHCHVEELCDKLADIKVSRGENPRVLPQLFFFFRDILLEHAKFISNLRECLNDQATQFLTKK